MNTNEDCSSKKTTPEDSLLSSERAADAPLPIATYLGEASFLLFHRVNGSEQLLLSGPGEVLGCLSAVAAYGLCSRTEEPPAHPLDPIRR